MSKKNKISKAEQRLAGLRESSLERFNDQIEKIEPLKNPAEKVLKLQILKDDIDATIKDIETQSSNIRISRAFRKGLKRTGIVMAVVTAAVVVPVIATGAPLGFLGFLAFAPVFGIPSGIKSFILGAAKELAQPNPALNEYMLQAEGDNAYVDKMLSDTVNLTSIKKMSSSPQFNEAFNKCERLRDRFAAAGAIDEILHAGSPAASPAKPKPEPKRQLTAPGFM